MSEPWFLAYERDEINKSGGLGAPIDPHSDVFGSGSGLLDALPDRLDTAEILIPRYAHPSMKTASLARHTGGREMSNSNDGALFSIKVQANDGTVLADINFPVTAWDLANADNWQSMFFEPANEVIVSQLKRRIDQQAAA